MKTYADQIEDAIASNDTDLLIKYAYARYLQVPDHQGRTTLRLQNVCKGPAQTIAPRALLLVQIERVGAPS